MRRLLFIAFFFAFTPFITHAAIAPDAAGFGTPYTVGSGANRILITTTFNFGTGGSTGCSALTYGGQSMTPVDSTTWNGGASYVQTWILVNPPSGSNAYVATTCASVHYHSLSYTGAKLSTQPDGHGIGTGSSATASNAVTVVASGVWVVATAGSIDGFNFTASTNLTARTSCAGGECMGDSNGTAPPSSYTQAANMASSGNWFFTQVAIKPVPDTFSFWQFADF